MDNALIIEQLEAQNRKLAAALRSMVFEFSHYVADSDDEHEAEALEEARAVLMSIWKEEK